MQKNLLTTFPITQKKYLDSLVENKTTYCYDQCELSVFETHEEAHDIHLTFDHFVLTSMLQGKKVMKLKNHADFEYLPGESLILSPGETMVIDFPEARDDDPTQCIALTISDDLIKKTIQQLNEQFPKEESWGDWDIDYSILHMENTLAFADVVNRMLYITQNEQGKAKDLMVGLTLQEMLIRLMQTQARHIFQQSHQVPEGPLGLAIRYIHENLTTRIDLDALANHACMSRAKFYRKFKEAMGETPLQYIMRMRLSRAADMLNEGKYTVTEVCYACGFNNLSHFITAFRGLNGVSPKNYQSR